MDKIELKNKIRKLEGLTNEEKSALIEMLNHQKKYGLVWEDKPEDVEERLRDELPVFREVKERAIVSDADDAPNHILIEGDNLEALTALSYTHAGKIDVIYIDPPYNTGNKDFVYNDSFVDSEDSFRHSKWLSFMDKRLKLAKGLLSDKGVIFISISDIEVAQLNLLCKEIFGEQNFVVDLIWSNKEGGGSSDSKLFRIKHEHILCLAKDITKISINGVEISNEERYKEQDEYVNIRGKYYLQKLGMGSIQYSESLDYGITAPDGTIVYPKDNNNGRKACWRWSKSKFDWGVNNGFIKIKQSKNAWTVYTKQYLKCDNDGNPIDRTQRPPGIIDQYSSTQAAKFLIHIGLDGLFNYSKPLDLIYYLLNRCELKNSTILDFFAGSGTTLHATMQLNKEDGGHRKCILVTNNENGICENVTYERNKRVINGYTTPKGEEVEGLHANTLRYYKTDFISRDQSPRNMRTLVAASTDLLCIKNDIYTEADFVGKKLNKKIVRYFEDRRSRMLVIYDERAIGAIVELLGAVEIDERGKIKVYTFSPSRYAFDDEFMEVADKVELCALPAAIYDAYKQVLPKRKLKYLPEALYEESTTTEPKRENIAAESDADYRKKGGKV